MNSQIRPDLVILEGPDKAGKSTIYQAFRKATFYQPLVIDRFIGSNIVYDQLHGRISPKNIDKYYQMEKDLLEIFNPLIVYLHAPVEILLKRSMMTGEYQREKFDIRYIGYYYEKYLESTPLESIEIDTHTHTEEKVIEAIQWELSHRFHEVKNQWSE